LKSPAKPKSGADSSAQKRTPTAKPKHTAASRRESVAKARLRQREALRELRNNERAEREARRAQSRERI
jgi:hypothetical protein